MKPPARQENKNPGRKERDAIEGLTFPFGIADIHNAGNVN
jgi:hypothetical protein